MDARLNINLHKNQQSVHENPARFRYIKSCKKFGKSWLGLYTIAKWAGNAPNGLFWYLAPTYGQVFDIGWLDLIRGQNDKPPILPPYLVKRAPENDMYVELVNGARIVFKGTENQDRLRGPNLNGCIFDEAAFMDYYVPVIIRSQLAVNRSPAMYLSTPNPAGTNWFTSACEDAQMKQSLGDKEFAYWKFTIHDNPLITEDEKKRLRDENTDATWNLEYMAEESAQAGILFSEFNPGIHVKEEAVEGHWMLVRGLDWGISHPTSCLWIYVSENPQHIYVADEFMRSDLRIEESCRVIKAMTGSKAVAWSVIDPSTKKRNSQTMLSDYDEFIRNGVPCIQGDNNYRGYDITKLMFKKNVITIHPKCRNLISQLKTIQYSGKFTTAKGSDDMTDPLRYACVRIHDTVFHGNVRTKEQEATAFKPNQFNLNDQLFGKQTKKSSMDWAYCNDGYEEVA